MKGTMGVYVASMCGFVPSFGTSLPSKSKPAPISAMGNSTAGGGSSSSSAVNAPNQALLAKAAFSQGNSLFQKGDVEGALKLFLRAVDLDDSHGLALTNIGNVYLQQKQLDKALVYHDRALIHRVDSCVAHYNVGVARHQLGKLPLAIESYVTALSLESTHVNARYNLALAYQDDNQLQMAIEEYRKLLAIVPEHLEGALNLCNVYYAQQIGFSDIEKCYLDIIEGTATPMPKALVNLASLYHAHARATSPVGGSSSSVDVSGTAQSFTDSAIKYYQLALTHDAKNQMALHGLYSIAAADQNTLTQHKEMSKAYIEELFDSYSFHFDDSLRNLQYNAHVLVARAGRTALLHHLGAALDGVEILALDLGCGTGLLCVPLRETGAVNLHITGVDISSKMVAKANLRDCYNKTVVRDVDTYLSESFDSGGGQYLIALAADVLVYFGNLETVLENTRKVLKKNGVFAFTVEKQLHAQAESECGFSLQFSGRFAHSFCYLKKVVNAQVCFKTLDIEDVVPRIDKGESVQGLLVTLQNIC